MKEVSGKINSNEICKWNYFDEKPIKLDHSISNTVSRLYSLSSRCRWPPFSVHRGGDMNNVELLYVRSLLSATTYLSVHCTYKTVCNSVSLLLADSRLGSSSQSSSPRRQSLDSSGGRDNQTDHRGDGEDDPQRTLRSACDVSAEAEGVLKQLEASRNSAIVAQTMQELTKVSTLAHTQTHTVHF